MRMDMEEDEEEEMKKEEEDVSFQARDERHMRGAERIFLNF